MNLRVVDLSCLVFMSIPFIGFNVFYLLTLPLKLKGAEIMRYNDPKEPTRHSDLTYDIFDVIHRDSWHFHEFDIERNVLGIIKQHDDDVEKAIRGLGSVLARVKRCVAISDDGAEFYRTHYLPRLKVLMKGLKERRGGKC